jgi:hypothetical protein
MKKILLFLILSLHINAFSQCPTGSASGACSGGGGALTNNYDFNTVGETRWVSGVASLGNSNMNSTGTILRICGTLTMSGIAMNSVGASLIVESGGTLNITGSWSPSQGKITNYGTINVAGDFTLNSASFYNKGIINLTGGARTFTINNSGSAVNNTGTISTNNFTIQATNTNILCLENNSCLTVTNTFTNNQSTSIYNGSAVPTKAAINIGSTTTFNNTLSSMSSIYVCKNGGGSAPTNIGSATWSNNCPSGCSYILPIDLIFFDGNVLPNYNSLTWITGFEQNNDYFTLERSKDAIDFEIILTEKGTNQNISMVYNGIDPNPYDLTYYRLKQTDFNGDKKYSEIISVFRRKQPISNNLDDLNLSNGIYIIISNDKRNKLIIR